jgi:hypothetical protein
VERLLPEDASPGVRDDDSRALGDAIARAVAPAIAFYHSSANAFTDPCADPNTCGIPHTHADIQPEYPVTRRTVSIDHRPLSSGTADDWHGMDGAEGSCGR